MRRGSQCAPRQIPGVSHTRCNASPWRRSPVAVRPRRVQADEHYARPVRPAEIPVVAVTPARTKYGMVRSGGEECGEWLHGKRSCRMLADASEDFRDEVWGQTSFILFAEL
jgi:hypothetical protein